VPDKEGRRYTTKKRSKLGLRKRTSLSFPVETNRAPPVIQNGCENPRVSFMNFTTGNRLRKDTV
jgi:hypothetical protein